MAEAIARKAFPGSGIVRLVDEQHLIGLEGLFFPRDQKHGIFTNVLGLVRDPFQVTQCHEQGEYLPEVAPTAFAEGQQVREYSLKGREG